MSEVEHNLPERILALLSETDESLNSLDVAQKLAVDHQKVVGAIKSLHSLGQVIDCEQLTDKQWQLTSEGEAIHKSGSHEAIIFNSIPKDGMKQADLMKLPNAKIGFSKAMSNGWIKMDKSCQGGPQVFRIVDDIDDTVRHCIQRIRDMKLNEVTDNQKTELRKRKLIQEMLAYYMSMLHVLKVNTYRISKGPEFRLDIEKPQTDLTAELLSSGDWKSANFKPYNFDALGIMPNSGCLHPLLKVRSEYRQIFLEMGFTEMPTNNFIESSFWNFDALFQPQQHPARDMHDTFFVSEPENASELPKDFMERVKKVHSVGDYGSQGYKYDWKESEARKNILRTHTTAVSARMLYKLAQQKPFKPVKYFSIDRVFRNETLDATHLAEFHQIEGVVADFNLTLGHLMGVIEQFFAKLGMTRLRFKPAYNPYTEPSMEIFAYHDGLKRWIEIGNSGVFRPEMLLPMGLPPDVSVIAWGLSLERPTMILYKLDNIRELIGPKVNLKMVQDNPICRLDKV